MILESSKDNDNPSSNSKERLGAISLLRELLGMKLEIVNNASAMGKSLKAIEDMRRQGGLLANV